MLRISCNNIRKKTFLAFPAKLDQSHLHSNQESGPYSTEVSATNQPKSQIYTKNPPWMILSWIYSSNNTCLRVHRLLSLSPAAVANKDHPFFIRTGVQLRTFLLFFSSRDWIIFFLHCEIRRQGEECSMLPDFYV